MASAYRLNDSVQINKINPTTWTGDFGINHDGFPQTMTVESDSYIRGISETPTVYTDPLTGTDDPNMNTSGAMYLKTAQVDPAPFRPFPARKFEYSDGTVTWWRPGLPWSWTGKANGYDDGYTKKLMPPKNNVIVILAIMALGLFLATKRMKS